MSHAGRRPYLAGSTGDMFMTTEAAESGPVDVDVIVLAQDRAALTIEALRSVMRQRAVRYIVWIVDQGSRAAEFETLASFANEYSRVRLCRLDGNLGVAGGRNFASSLGTAPLIAAIDSDAEFEGDHALAGARDRFAADSRLGFLGFRILRADDRADDWSSWDYGDARRSISAENFAVATFCGCGHVLRRDAFEKVGGYDEALFFLGEEKDLAYRLMNAGYHGLYDGGTAVLHKCAREHRIHWESGRYYFCVRNSVYLNYKFGASPLQLALTSANWLVRGMANGMPGAGVRGFRDALRLAAAFRRRPLAERLHYRLSPEAAARIADCSLDDKSFLAKVRASLKLLPRP